MTFILGRLCLNLNCLGTRAESSVMNHHLDLVLILLRKEAGLFVKIIPWSV